MNTEMLTQILWAVCPSIVVGIFMAFWNRGQKKRDDHTNAREKERLRSETLRISLLVASAQLSYASAMALKRGYANGEVEEAVVQYDKAMREFRAFEREQLVKSSLD